MRPSTLALGLAILATLGLYGYGVSYQKYTKKSGKRTKQDRRAELRSNRRSRKDERLKTKKLERSQVLATDQAEMTDEQKNEERERIRMHRVEQYQKLNEAPTNGLRVVVDLAFAVNQTTRERNSLFKQLGCVYGYLKTCPLDSLVSLHITSCTNELTIVCAQHGVPSWKIGQHEEPLEQLYSADELVYLSPDSDNVLGKLNPNCVYVVGGIVDRSVRKGETKAKATARGIRTARLPLQEHFHPTGAKVRTHIMNVDSVIISLNEVANHGDWGRAFQKAVPPRISRAKGDKKQRHVKNTSSTQLKC